MAGISALQSSWAQLGQTLGSTCSGTAGNVGNQCTGAIFRHAQISGRVADWNNLPASDARYDPVITALDGARQKLSAANGDPGAMIAALSSANAAMSKVEALLDG
jgi:hypothetical protein